MNSVMACMGRGVATPTTGCKCNKGYVGPVCQYGPFQYAQENDNTNEAAAMIAELQLRVLALEQKGTDTETAPLADLKGLLTTVPIRGARDQL